jgi:hypothetical protein
MDTNRGTINNNDVFGLSPPPPLRLRINHPPHPTQSNPHHTPATTLLGRLATAGALTLSSMGGLLALSPIAPAHADGSTTRFVLPPVDEKDKTRCVMVGLLVMAQFDSIEWLVCLFVACDRSIRSTRSVDRRRPFSHRHTRYQPPTPILKLKPPPTTKNVNSCKFTSSEMGQANAARDKLYDLRLCDLRCVRVCVCVCVF